MIINRKKYKILNENTEKHIFNRILELRNIKKEDLNKGLEGLISPFLLKDMEESVSLIKKHLKNKSKILVFGDYDGDGTTATYILYHFLKGINDKTEYFIPDRLNDGYGLNPTTLEKIIDRKYDLIITVDCGITSINEVEILNNKKVDIIITDHHQVGENIPNCLTVNPTRKDCSYPFKTICGSFISLKLVQALCLSLDMPFEYVKYIPYATIGTITDVMPLINENRHLVSIGIQMIRAENINLGLKTLIKNCKDNVNITEITSTDIGFYVGPIINASSRIDKVDHIIKLFLSNKYDECDELIKLLKKLNQERKDIEKNILEDCFEKLKTFDMNKIQPIIVYSKNWHKGVIGIVASRLVEFYKRPCIILSYNEEKKEYSGSCRNIGNCNIVEVLNNAKEYLTKFGGHFEAGGLTLKEENLESFINKTNEFFEKKYTIKDFEIENKVDLLITKKDLELKNLDIIKYFEPFGNKNEEITYLIKNVSLVNIKKIGKKENFIDAHLFLELKIDNIKIEAVSFFYSHYFEILSNYETFDIVCSLQKNVFNNETKLQIIVKDFIIENKYEDIKIIDFERSILLKNNKFNFKELKDNIIPTTDDYKNIFLNMRKLLNEKQRVIICLDYLKNILNIDLDLEKLGLILEVLKETNYFIINKIDSETIYISFNNEDTNKINISETTLYKKLHLK